MASGKYLDSDQLVTRLNPTTFIAIYDDNKSNNVNGVNDDAVQQAIDGAEGEVDSYLVAIDLIPLPVPVRENVDRLVRVAALDYAEALSFLRHPELPRTFGENEKAKGLWSRAEKRMERVRKAIQELPDVTSTGALPSNTGGFVQTSDPEDPTGADSDGMIFRDTGIF